MAESDSLVRQLASLRPTVIFHSGLSRSRWLGERVRTTINYYDQACELLEDVRLRERNFGDWEGRTWDDVYASDPDNFHGLIDKPDTYRPPGGETTTELQRRVVQWYQQCGQHQSQEARTVIAITHSGPIAALAGHLLKLTPEHWSPWMLGYGEIVTISSQPKLENEVEVAVKKVSSLTELNKHSIT
jgi:broad specificity phosphatase PhoE